VNRAINWFAVAAGGAIVLVAFLVLPWFLVLIFGEEYRESVPYAQALMCSVALSGSVPLRTRFISSQQDAGGFRDINVGMAITRIVGSAVFIPLWGLTGAVVAAFVARLGNAVVVHFVLKKRYPMEAEQGDS
jgi:O-antigen/teichoic acid export membrane protein